MLAAAVAEFRSAKKFVDDGATSTIAWLRDRGRQTKRAATRTVTIASRVAGLPVTWAAWRDGTLSEGQVEAIVANLSAATVERYRAQEAELVPWLAPLSVAGVARAMRVWKAHAEAELDAPVDQEQPEHLQLSSGLDGRWVLEGELGSEVGQALSTALRLAERPNEDGETRKASERRAEALGDICRFFLDHQNAHPGGRHRPHLNVILEVGDLAAGRPGRFADGTTVDATTLARLACDAAVHRVVMAGVSTILDYGTATRTIPASLWNALVVRDEGCRFPACDRPASWTDGHHVRWVQDGGSTSLANLVLVCRSHHTLLHKGGWQAHLADDGTFTVTDPRGRVRTTSPPRALLAC